MVQFKLDHKCLSINYFYVEGVISEHSGPFTHLFKSQIF